VLLEIANSKERRKETVKTTIIAAGIALALTTTTAHAGQVHNTRELAVALCDWANKSDEGTKLCIPKDDGIYLMIKYSPSHAQLDFLCAGLLNQVVRSWNPVRFTFEVLSPEGGYAVCFHNQS
jgi:hypothetical protein